MQRESSGKHIIPARIYIIVWIGLLICLAATIAVSKMQILAGFSVLGSLVIASIKALLVLAFFMHLAYEGWFLKIMLATAVCALTVLIGLTFADVWLR